MKNPTAQIISTHLLQAFRPLWAGISRGYPIVRVQSLRCAFAAMLAVAWLLPLLDQPVLADQITLQMDIHQAGSAAGDNLGYYAFAFLNSTNTPITYYEVYSWNTNYQFVGGVGTGSYTYGLSFGSLGDMLNAFTNGPWKLVLNVGDPSQKTYYFSMSAPNFTATTFPAVHVLSPTNGAVNVTNNPIFTWTGTNNYPEVDVNESGNYQGFYSSATLPPASTNWNPGQPLNEGVFTFDVTYFNSNAPSVLLITTPTNSLGQSPPGWVTTNRLFADDSSTFTVGAVDSSGTAHTLVAHYTWDGTNGDGTASGVDSSGNGYSINFTNGFGAQGGANSTTTAAAGPRAIQFHDGDGNSAGYVGWNPTPAGLLSALSGSFSVSCWIKTTQSGFGWDQAPAYYGAGIVSADNSGLANDVIPLALTGNKIGFNTGGSFEDDTVNSATSVNDGNYHHVVVTRNQLTGQKIIYIDGALDSFSSGTTNLLMDPQKLTIGALADASDPDPTDLNYYNGYDGELDDLQIYSGVLSAGDVGNLYANPGTTVANGGGNSGEHAIVGRYNFEQTNSPGLDTSGHGNNSNCGGGDGNTNYVDTFSTDAAVGSYSRSFLGHTFICFAPTAVSFTNLARALSGSFSVSAWVKTTQSFNNDGDNADSGAFILFAENANTNSTVPLALTGSKVAFSVNDHNGISTTLHSLTSVNDGQYHQIAVTRNQANGVMKVYVDGKLEGTASGTTDLIYINSIIALGGYYNDYNGLLDDVQLYSGVLADADVASLFAHPGTTIPDVTAGAGGLVVHYDFDEGTVLAHDVSGNGNNMVYAGNFGGSGPSISSDAAAGSGSVSFDGDSYLTSSSNLLSTLAGEFSVSLWLKTSQNFGSQNTLAWQGAGVIAADSPNYGAKDLIPVALTGGQVAFNIGDGISDNTLNSSGTVNDNSWHHVVVTRNQSTGTRQIFIDGALDSFDTASTVLLNSPVLLTIGAKADASNPDPTSPDYTGSNGYQGLLDDVQIYDRVLSANEVTYLYNNPGATITSVATPGLSVIASPLSGLAPLTVQFTSPGVDSAGNTVTNWNWSFGNGGASTAQSPSYTYNSAGSFSPTLTAYSTYGATPLSVTGLGVITVTNPPNMAPVITLNPFNQTNYPGYSAALLAGASGYPSPTWQWFKVATGLIPNATNALYIPTNSGTAGVAGSYYAVASNIVGLATSSTATVSFVSAPLPPDWSAAFKSPFFNNNLPGNEGYISCLQDSSSNLYAVGFIYGTNSIGSTNYTSPNGSYSADIVKQTPTGNAIWATGVTNNGNGNAQAYCVVPAPGNGIYVAGNFNGTNWLGTNRLVDLSAGEFGIYSSIFLARLDANGNPLWVRTISGTNFCFMEYYGLVSDPAGNVTLSGLFSATTIFNSTNLTTSTNLFAPGQSGGLAQYDSNGALRWAEITTNWIIKMTYNGGRIYGTFGNNSTNFSFGTIPVVTDRAKCVTAINEANGQPIWVRGCGAPFGLGNPFNVVYDDAGVAVSGTNVFIVGTAIASNAAFGSYSVSWPDYARQYLARCDTNGTPQFITSFGSDTTMPWSILPANSGGVYVSGDFDTYSFFGNDILAGQHLGSIGTGYFSDSFLAKFDANGNPLWARSALPQSNLVNLRGLAPASDGVWVCGVLQSPTSFGSILVGSSLTCIGSPFCTLTYYESGVLAKITDGTVSAMPVTLFNPQDGGVNFQFQFLSQSGFSHSILYRTNLVEGSWQTNSTIAGDGTVKTISLPLSLFSPSKQGFIRVSTQ